MNSIIQQTIFNGILATQTGGAKEKFQNAVNPTMDNIRRMSKYQLISLFVTLIIVQILLLLVGKWLWNNFLVKVTDAIKPVPNIWTIFGISILFKLIL